MQSKSKAQGTTNAGNKAGSAKPKWGIQTHELKYKGHRVMEH